MSADPENAAPPREQITPRGNPSRPELLIALALCGAALTAYLSYFTAQYSYDSVASGVLLYQRMAGGSAGTLFHRYHVLYLPAAAAVEQLLKRIGVEVDPLTLLQVLNGLFAAGSAALYYLLLRALAVDRILSALLTVLFAGGFSAWYYATNGESYPISIYFLLLAFLSAARLTESASWMRTALPGVWLGLAADFHGTCLLALPGLVVLSWPTKRERSGAVGRHGNGADPVEAPGRRNGRVGAEEVRGRGHAAEGIGRPAAALAAAAIVFGAPYVVRYLLIQRTDPLSGLAADSSALAREAGWSVVPHLFDQWRSLAWSMVSTDWPSLRSSYPLLASASALGLLAVTLLPVALVVRLWSPRIPRGSPLDSGGNRLSGPSAFSVLAIVVWFASVFVFFSMYFAGSSKFASYQWAPLLLLVGLALQEISGRASVRRAAVAILTLVAGAALFCSFDLARRMPDAAANPHLARARAIERLTEPSDLVVHLGRGENQYLKVYLPYFAVRRSLVLERFFDPGHPSPDQSLQALAARLTSAASGPGRIVALTDAVEAGPSSREFEAANGMSEGSIASFFAAYRPRLLAQDPAAGKLWLLTAAQPGPQE